MVSKTDKNNVGISLPKEFVAMIDKILEAHPDFKTRPGVIRYAVRRYYDEIFLEKR